MRTRNPRGIRKIDVQRERRASYREAIAQRDAARKADAVYGGIENPPAGRYYAEHPDAQAVAQRVIELALPDLTLISFDDAAELELWPVLEA
jgi:regulator of protease activity HflC (stomatin/prohibitin superfamily)